MNKISIIEAHEIIPSLSPEYERRRSVSQEDWGDNATILAALKRRGKDFYTLNIHTDFATYLGNNVVGIVGLCREIVYCMQYESQEEMKADWVLD